MKYQTERTVEAVYTPASYQNPNPFVEAMPDLLTKEKLFARIKASPKFNEDVSSLSATERRRLVPLLSTVFVPMNYMYRLYDTIYRAIETTYMTMTAFESIRQLNAIFASSLAEIPRADYLTQSECGSILGVPGVGKTSTIKRCVSTMPQVINHSSYQGKPFFCKQITYLFIECPSDCSVKTLGYNVANAIDTAIGSNYLEQMIKTSKLAASAIALYVKQLCINHHVGCIIMDEIQNAVQTAHAQRQTNKLIKFLVELMNDTCTSVYLIGTLDAEDFFLKEEHLKRRTRGGVSFQWTPERPTAISSNRYGRISSRRNRPN